MLLAALAAGSCGDLATEPERSDPAMAAAAQVVDDLISAAREGCAYGTLPAGALLEICFPATWNGGVVFYAHGYVAAGEPLAVPDEAVDGLAVADIARALGFVYATTSYRDNGLVAADAVEDLEQLAAVVQGAHPLLATATSYLIGVSEGGLATALAMQNASSPFDGGLALCGPVGNFRAQTNYLGDFRLVFDYFFPGVLPGAPFDPTDLLALQPDWESTWEPAIEAAIASDIGAGGELTRQLFAVTRAPQDPTDPGQTAADILWYAVFGTPDAVVKLGGTPFENTTRTYSGSDDDILLNADIPRIAGTANPAELDRYETTGRIERQTVAMHTTGDQIIPYLNLPLYTLKALAQGDMGSLIPLTINRYGHCQFTVPELLTGFAVLALRVGSQQILVSSDLFRGSAEESDFMRMARARGLRPTVRDPTRH